MNPMITAMSSSEPKYIPRPVIEPQKEAAKQLKEEITKDLLSISDKPLIEQLRLIDSIERLGVAYHFEKEIDDALLRIYETSIEPSSDDLFLTSLRFRLLRQHGFKEEVANDIHGILELYDACYVRVHGEDILEKALPLTISILNKTTNTSLEERITHALQMPLHKRAVRYDCVHYMQVYEEDDLLHKSLLKFAKLDFNLLQGLHKQELSDLCRYWKDIDFPCKLPLRDRMVEGHTWSIAGYFEPHYSLGRKITCIGGHVVASIDDIYDAYTTLEEAEIFTEAVERWDKSCLEKVPQGLRWFYKTLLLDAHEEFERLLAPSGRSQYVHYAKQEIKALCRSYMTEARWRQKKYIPTLDEYMQNDLYRNSAYVSTIVYFFLGLDTATDHEFQWLCNLASPVKAVSYQLRILNDVGGNKFDENRGLSSLFIECYMKEYGMSYEEASKELYMKVGELWKDINEGMVRPSEVAPPVYNTIINMGRAVEAFYNGGEDGYTLVNHNLKQIIKNMYIDPISM
ncbi:hypothetical protein V2J09_000233 [Rumex salicifolius]